MKARSISLISFFAIVLMAKASFAAEIITIEDFKQDLVMKEHLVKVADNAIFLFDGSSSMNKPYKDTGQSRYDVAVAEFKKRNAYMPDLGHNFGLYLYTPWKPIYPMQPYEREKFAAALDSLPPRGDGLTLLQVGLKKIDPVLAKLSGDTVVFLFTDGTYTKTDQIESFGGNIFIAARHTAKALADKYDVCFYVISTATKKKNRKMINNLAKVNACSRVIPFEAYIDRPEFNSGALFTVRSSMNLETTSDMKVVGLTADNIQFEFDQAELQPAALRELDEVGQFLRQNYSAFIALEAFTDNRGSKEYNQVLSRRRAHSVADYLRKNHRVNPNRVVMQWYGDADPIASNDTSEGRAQNRRVEMSIGGVQ